MSTGSPEDSVTEPTDDIPYPAWLDSVHWNEAGLVPAIAQDSTSGQILMMAWMNRESLQETAATGIAVYFSRSRQKLWRKGETSGHTQRIVSIQIDCDEDVILLSVEQIGGIACHTGRAHCFYRTLSSDGVWETTDAVVRDPTDIYGEPSAATPSEVKAAGVGRQDGEGYG